MSTSTPVSTSTPNINIFTPASTSTPVSTRTPASTSTPTPTPTPTPAPSDTTIVDEVLYASYMGINKLNVDPNNNLYLSSSSSVNASPVIKNKSGTVVSSVTFSQLSASFCKINNSRVLDSGQFVSSGSASGSVNYVFDASGNYFISGIFFAASATLYNKDGVAQGIIYNGGGSSTIPTSYVSKFSPSGTHLFTHIFTSTVNSIITDITCDSSGNLIVCGGYVNNAKIYYGMNTTSTVAATYTVPTGGLLDRFIFFVTKFDSSGNLKSSAFVATGLSALNMSLFVRCDSLGNIYLAGTTDSVYIYNSAGVSYGVAENRTASMGFFSFVIKFDANVIYSIYRCIKNTSSLSTYCYDLAFDSNNNFYLVGEVLGSTWTLTGSTITYNGGSTTITGYICKFNTSGAIQFIKNIAPSSYQIGLRSITIDKLDNVYISGYYSYSPNSLGLTVKIIENDLAKSTINGIPPNASANIILMKFDSSGTYKYIKYIGSGSTESVVSLANSNQFLYIVTLGGASGPTVIYNEDLSVNYTSPSNFTINNPISRIYILK